MESILVMRALERIAAVAVGGLCVYLGYRLFAIAPTNKNAEGKLTLPGGLTVYMARLGPGAFFALFGCCVVGLSFYHSISFTEEPVADAGIKRQYSGAGPSLGVNPPPRMEPWDIDRDLRYLNQRGTPMLVRSAQTIEDKTYVGDLMARAKLGLMLAMWDDAWGSRTEFANWVVAGATDPPDSLKQASNLFLGGN